MLHWAHTEFVQSNETCVVHLIFRLNFDLSQMVYAECCIRQIQQELYCSLCRRPLIMWYNCYSFVNNTSNIGRIGYILYVLADITKRPVVLRVGFSFHFLCYFIDCYGEFAIHNVFSFDVNDFHFFFYFSCLFVIKFIYFDLRLFFHFPFLNDFLYVFLHLGS